MSKMLSAVGHYFLMTAYCNLLFAIQTKITESRYRYLDPSDCRKTNITEIKALFGLLYLMGLHHGGRMNISDFWSTDGMGVERFPVTMGQRRFKFLLFI